MFANLSNPMAYIISFQMAVLLVPAFTGLYVTLRQERREARKQPNLRIQDSITEPATLEIPRAA
ncbi:MAG: hypothetical protein EOP11_23405 [Proteobacteria bacterium]|nr:MAG: hypothetical protein EOP11_23405 [Pseudomonadota bacterium]